MYGTATFKMSAVLQPGLSDWIPRITLGVALIAWAATFAGYVHVASMSGRTRLQRSVS